MTDPRDSLLGLAAYEGYCHSSNGRSLVTGDILPPWQRLNPDIQLAWVYAAEAVVNTDEDLQDEVESLRKEAEEFVGVELVPVEVFGTNGCGQCQHCEENSGYGICDAVQAWSDCNRAIGHVYRVEDTPGHREFGDSITVQVHKSDMPWFKKEFGSYDDTRKMSELERLRKENESLRAELLIVINQGQEQVGLVEDKEARLAKLKEEFTQLQKDIEKYKARAWATPHGQINRGPDERHYEDHVWRV